MADAELKCDHCGKTITVSEFVDYATLYCKQCGGKIGKPDRLLVQEAAESKYHLKAPMAQHPEAAAAAAAADDVVRADSANLPRVRKLNFRHDYASWVLFAAIAAGMYVVRYRGVLSPEHLGYLTAYGPYALLLAHILVVLRAFKESVFQGILCLIIPFYSLYYLFLVTDAFYLRAVIGGLLAGIAEDSFYFYKAVATEAYDRVQGFISSGGGETKFNSRNRLP